MGELKFILLFFNISTSISTSMLCDFYFCSQGISTPISKRIGSSYMAISKPI